MKTIFLHTLKSSIIVYKKLMKNSQNECKQIFLVPSFWKKCIICLDSCLYQKMYSPLGYKKFTIY